ncbi:hypothetical protein HPULCUR_004051 [Helicostylum pulchrum]|uniref:Rap-GAP domain-containing protein n=1 Tax=Helicostylum pulchrum TaxID=562976 RepID=A0ABP9XV32_9FUNG
MRKAAPSTSSMMKGFVGHEKPTTTSSISEDHLGIDGPLLPSTSTFTLAGKDDKPEKLKKKAKNFLDERQKTKSRAQSLWSFIDATNTFDQARFFQEHAEQVFQVVFETCMHQIEKIKHKSERPQSWNSKELVSLQKTLLLLRKIFLYVPELMRNGWQRQNIAIILSYILDHGNHPRLRALGFQLLLLWLNDQVVEYPECMNLFSNAISLDLFILDDIQTFNNTPSTCSTNNTNTTTNTNNIPVINPDLEESNNNSTKLHSLQFVKKLRENHADKQINHGLQRDERIKSSSIQLHQTFILGDDAQPLFPNPTQPTFNDSIVLIHIFISNLVRLAYVAAGSPPPPDEYEYPPGDHFEPDDGIATGVGIDAATASAKFLFKIFRTHYMTKFVPLISKSLQVEGSLKTGVSGFPSCPPTILRSLLRFLIGYCLDNNHNVNINWPHLSQISSPATPILKSIVLSSHETREMLHEILRQSLILPSTNIQYRDITRGAIHILGVWILGSEDERPSFLRRSGSIVTRSSSTASVSNSITTTNNNENLCPRPFSTSPIEEHAMPSYEDYSDANVFLRRYLLMIKLVFEDRRPEANNRDNLAASAQQVSDWEGLVALYKDAINVYRAISVSRGGIDIEWESWELMLQCLLDIQQWFMSQPEKYSRIPVQALAEELADYIWETLLFSFVRAKILHMELWKNLKVHMVSSMRWVQALNQWVKIMQKLTRLLSSRLYKVDYELHSDNRHRLIEEFSTGSNISNRYSSHFGSGGRAMSGGSNRVKVRSRHLSMQGNPRHGGSPKRGASGRPLSACGSEGQLTDMKPSDKHVDPVDPTPEGSVSTILRNLSSASLSELANTFKTDRKSTNLTSVPDEELEEESEENIKIKFGLKTMKPSTSNTPASSINSGSSNALPINNSVGKRSNTNNSGNSLTGSVGEKSVGRRTISIQQLDTLWQDSGSKLLNFVHHGENNHPQPTLSKVLPVKDEEKKVDWDRRSTTSSIDEISNKSNRTPSSSVWASGESITMMTNPASITEKLPTGLGAFKCSEFLVLSSLPYDGQQVLAIWKNMLLTIGNINHIEGPQNHAIAMRCVVDILDTLRLVRDQQPYRDVPIPAMYEVAPWLFQAAELPPAFDVGKSAAYGSLCRLMSQRPEETVPEGYYAAFYKAVLKGLASKDNTIIQAIISNSERLFEFSLPGVHILIPSFINAIEELLLNDDTHRDVPSTVKKSCITILGSLVSISNHLKDVSIQLDKLNMVWAQKIDQESFSFADIKVWLKNVFIRLVNACPVTQHDDDCEVHSMLLGALCTLVLDEMLATESPQYDIIHECILSLVNHLYWCNMPIVNNVADCLVAFAHIYKEELDPEGIIVQEVITRIIDSLNVHLKYYERNTKNGRGFIISKLFCCLLEWLMSIEPAILTETDLCQLVFDVIEVALHVSLEGAEKLLPRSPRHTDSKKKETPFKFKLLSEKRPHIQYDLINNVEVPENDQGYVKESAEAVLLHLLHHFNNFAPPYGPAMIHSSIIGPGVAQDDVRYSQYQYFSFNDTTIIAFVEIPKTETKGAQARMIIRDLTGRYVWDTQLEPKMAETDLIDHSLEKNEFELRQDVRIKSVDQEPKETEVEPVQDPMGNLLKQIGDLHPDCLLDPSLPLNVPSACTCFQMDMLGDLSSRMNEYLHNEAQNNQQQESDIHVWYNKMNMLRKKDGVLKREDSMQTQLMTNFSLQKDFLPALPQEAEQPNVPFQMSRLLLSHMGLVQYSHLKDGSFKMLNKTPALYRDLRGLDRKHGRETMKIGLIYVAHGQEDEQSILQNYRGSERYNAFVNSLGWEIDIATHAGYLGGLEKNLTNGTKATYYCSSTVEMIFHDVTKMPTDTSDPKQLKKKRHIGNDHVHIIWNEHDRDYRTDTIGGDFGNAQIIVTPLADNLYLIQVHRDSKYQEQKIMDALSQTPSPNTFSEEEESYFSDRTSFRSHRLPQSNSLRCSICQRRFHSQGNLSNHNQLYH